MLEATTPDAPRARRPLARLSLLAVLALATAVLPVRPASADVDPAAVDALYRELNTTRSVTGTDVVKSWKIVFDAYLESSEPPIPVGEAFNQTLIHPGMLDWAEVASWAESNQALAEAIESVQAKPMFGLPYGADAVDAKYADADLVAVPMDPEDPLSSRFPYLDALDRIAAFSVAESYRRLEAGQHEEGLGLQVATVFFLRQCCDREFRNEQYLAISLLTEALDNLRDMFYTYLEAVPSAVFEDIAIKEIPYLRPDRQRLLMPEGDKQVARVILESVFDENGQAIRDDFAATFARIQAEQEPLTIFGAARRWRMIADIHDSLESSLERLRIVYDDWWRRWRVQEFDAILSIPTEFSVTNQIRYAAVLYSIQDVQELFRLRNVLRASVNGTAMAAGIAGNISRTGSVPAIADAMYAVSVRKLSDVDPYDSDGGTLKYAVVSGPTAIDTAYGRVTVPAGSPMLWSRGEDATDDRGTPHFDDGVEGDIVFWPPLKAVLREQGVRQ